MKKDLSVLYMIKQVLLTVREEMVKRNMSFDEFLVYWDKAIDTLEKEQIA